MITKAVKNMLPQLITLWEECFGDPEEYSSFFFTNNLKGIETFDNLYVYMKDGQPVSMLTVLEAELFYQGQIINFWYIYGVATAKEHRSKGYAGELLHYVLDVAQENNAVAGLVPAQESLFGYYEKFGFKTSFYKKVWEYSLVEVNQREISKQEYQISSISYSEYNVLRNTFLQGITHIEWNDSAVKYAIEENSKLGGETLRIKAQLGEFFIMYYAYEGVLSVRETNLPFTLLKEVVEDVCRQQQCKKAIVSLSCVYNEIGHWTSHAMLYGMDEISDDSYFGLALD